MHPRLNAVFTVLLMIISICAGTLMIALWQPVPTADAAGTSILISQLQTGGSASGHAGDELIRLTNSSAVDVSVDKWTVKYRAASTAACMAGWSTKYTFAGVTIPSGGSYTLVATGYDVPADAHFSAGLSSTAGGVRVFDGGGQTIDTVGWGGVNSCAEGTALPTLTDGDIVTRHIDSVSGQAIDSDDNAGDFDVQSPVLAVTAGVTGTGGSGGPIPALLITEMLPDPAAPLVDSHDEFVEIYNPNATAVSLNGYVIKTGLSFGNKVTLPNVSIAPAAYYVLTSGASSLTLANAGSNVALFGRMVSKSALP